MFDIRIEEELKDAFSSEKIQPLSKHDHQQKGFKIFFKIINYIL